MSSFEKLVKLACKPKAAAPKSKYIEPLVSATYADDGSIHDICRALAPRFKEPNAVIVFKALIVLHTVIRQGQTDNVLKYLASSDVLRLRNVTNGQWDGYMPPQNLAAYAIYLDSRVKTYKELKHDAIRVQSESNRDRLSTADDEGPSTARPVQRSKTVMGRKLRVMTVEKGLLRETKMVQRLTDALLECKLYDDSLDDELNVTALRMLVKDLLILFQATNEGVINVLEHYFEMSHVDAENALKIYQHFCKQTERVVNYLGIAKKLQNVLNVQIPNLRHAPVSLAKTLEEYIKDPNFEDNRLEYRNSRIIADGGSAKTKDSKTAESKSNPSVKVPDNSTAGASTSTEAAKPDKSELLDFFASIEQEQPSMFDPHSQSPTNNYFQQQSQFNPFVQRQMGGMNGPQPFMQPQATGFVPSPNNPFPQQSQQPFLVPQATAVPFQPQAQPLQPQATAMPFLQPQATAMPFLQPQDTAVPFLRPQDTARPFQPQQQQPFGQPAPFLQPQATGSNPFRQTMLMPQSTGVPTQNPFPSNPFPSTTNPFPSSNPAAPFPSSNPATAFPSSNPGTPFPSSPTPSGIARPASTPIGGAERKSTSFGQSIAPLVAQTTGSRNPFGPVAPAPPPPVPKLPTMGELASGAFGGAFGGNANTNGQTQGQGGFGQTNGGFGQNTGGTFGQNNGGAFGQNNGGTFGQSTGGAFGQTNGGLQPQATGAPSKSPFDMSSIASSFALGNDSSKDASENTPTNQMKPLDPQATATSSAFSSDRASMFSAQPTGSSFSSSFGSTGSLAPQITGFGGSNVKAFKPTSSFGAELMDNLPSSNSSTSPFGAAKSDSSAPSFSFSSSLSSQPTGASSAFGSGLSSQPTGLSSQTTGLSSQPTGFGSSALGSQPTGAFGSTLGAGSGLNAGSGFGAGSGLGAGSSLGAGLRPQLTGTAGGANPFRASMFNNLGSGANAGATNTFPAGTNGTAPFSSAFGGSTSPFGAAPTGQQQSQQQQQQQQQPSFSLI